MSNKFGLYIVDATEYLAREGYPEPNPTPINDTWVRTALKYEGKHINTTAIESNNFGIYQKDDKLRLNGSMIATLSSDINASVSVDSDGINFGDAILSRPSGVINITLDDYNSLRKGEVVEGYARYNDKAVYNIVEDIDTAPSNIEFVPPDGIYDVIYNNKLDENFLTDATLLDINTPQLALRHVDQYGIEGEGITLEYFVDTRCYDSVNKGEIGDTFTIIVTDSYGNDLYYYEEDGNIKHYTTYAGHYRIKLRPFTDEHGNNITGKTWFSIRCIDKHNRGTCEYFFSVYIRESNYKEKPYEMKVTDLDRYAITPNSNNAVDAYKNRCGFARLINDIQKKIGNFTNTDYNCIKLYNPHPDTEDITNVGIESNWVYYINIYPDRTYYDVDADLTNNSYKDRNQFNLATQDYYIFRYTTGDGTSANPAKLDTIDIKGPNDTQFVTKGFATVDGLDSAINWNKLTSENIEAFKIESGKTFRLYRGLDAEDRPIYEDVTVPQFSTENELLDWIWNDGAGICRDANNRIVRCEGGMIDNNPNTESYISNWRTPGVRCLRVIPINDHMRRTSLYKHKASYTKQITPGNEKDDSADSPYHYPFKPGDGYYYVSLYKGISGNGNTDVRRGISDLQMLSNFTIDFNYTSWILYDAFLSRYCLSLLDLSLCEDVEVRNGWIKGAYDRSEADIIRLLKRGYITQNIIANIPWEGCGIANVIAGRFAKFTNMRITGSLGYDIMAHGPGSSEYVSRTANSVSKFVDRAGYVSVSGNNISDNRCLIKDNDNNSLLSPTSFDYNATESTDICLATTSDYISLSDVTSTGYKARLTHSSTVNSRNFDDEFVVGHWDNRYIMKYPEMFVHFYRKTTNNNDTTYTYIRSVKTQINKRIKKLNGATHIKVSMYMTGAIVNGSPKVYLPLNIVGNNLTGSKAVPGRLQRYKISSCGVTENVIYDSCYFGISKSSMIEPTAINMCIINCNFDNVNRAPKGVSQEHPYPMSSEEHGGLQMLFNVDNSHIQHSSFITDDDDSDTDSLGQMKEKDNYQIRFSKGGASVNIRDSVGFTLYGAMDNAYIADSWLNGLSFTAKPSMLPITNIMAKNTIIRKRGTWDTSKTFDEGNLEYLTTGKGTACSASEEKVNTLLNLENCFFNRPILSRVNNCSITSRQFNCGDYAVDVLYDGLPRLRNLWEHRTDDDKDKNHGWTHIIVYAPHDNYPVPIGHSSAKDYIYKETNGYVAYIDGVKHNVSLSTTVWTNPAKPTDKATLRCIYVPEGHHVVSYKFLPKQLPTSSGVIIKPFNVLLVEFPDMIDNNFSFAKIFKATNGSLSYLRIINYNNLYQSPVILNNTKDSIKLDGTGGTYQFEAYIVPNTTSYYTSGWSAVSFIEGEEFDLSRLI